MRRKAGDVVRAARPDSVDVQRAGSTASPNVPCKNVRERHRRVVRCRVSNPQTAICRDDDIARRHSASVATFLAHAAIRRRAHSRVKDQRIVSFLEEVSDAVERSARPVASRDRRGSTPTPVGQLGDSVRTIELEQLVISGKQNGRRAVRLHQLMDHANVVSAQVAGARVNASPPFARADAAILINDAVIGHQGKASIQIKRRVLSIQAVETRR